MKLAAEIPGMAGELADLDVNAVGGFAGETQAVFLEDGFVLAVEFVAVAVALTDFGLSVGGARVAAFSEIAGIGSETHGTAELVDTFQLSQLIDDAVGSGLVEL